MSTQLSLFPAGTLRLHTSNQLERLAAQLNETLATPLSSPLAPEVVLVQSRGSVAGFRCKSPLKPASA